MTHEDASRETREYREGQENHEPNSECESCGAECYTPFAQRQGPLCADCFDTATWESFDAEGA